jgi:hypothetical protein
MKKLTKRSLLLSGLMLSMMTFANGNVETINEKELKVTNISFDNVKLGSRLSIKDIKGIVLYNESITKDGNYSKGFDLTALPNGDYFFELDTEFEVEIIPFNVVSNQVVFKKDEKSKIFKPNIRIKDDKVFVSRFSFEKSPLKCNIYYADNNDLVRSEKFLEEIYSTKVYDFSEALKGEYIFVFESDGRKFTKSIKI